MPTPSNTALDIDHKQLFAPYDCVPSYELECAFDKDLMAYGGHSDDHGWSYAYVFLGLDDGGRNGAPLPTAPGANNEERASIRCCVVNVLNSHTSS
mmetsp:Transcript_39055/g.83261  ORF Transcript_39055/g.83261 Transcript_39055/m.83261 type:complete len:96 (+) Transcript_39055:173-460(+)